MKETTVVATDLLTKEKQAFTLHANCHVSMIVPAYGGRAWKMKA